MERKSAEGMCLLSGCFIDMEILNILSQSENSWFLHPRHINPKTGGKLCTVSPVSEGGQQVLTEAFLHHFWLRNSEIHARDGPLKMAMTGPVEIADITEDLNRSHASKGRTEGTHSQTHATNNCDQYKREELGGRLWVVLSNILNTSFSESFLMLLDLDLWLLTKKKNTSGLPISRI